MTTTPLEKLGIIIIGLAIAAAICAFTGCAGMRVTGTLETQYGSISSDGKTVNLVLPTRGYAK